MTQRKVKTSYPHPDTAAPSGDRPVALVTGASSGIGKALCLVLGRHGYEVAMIARGQAALENAAEEVEAAGGVPMVVPADVTNRNAHEAALDTILARTGRVDVAVAAAGLGYATPAESLDLERLQRMIDVNVTGFVNTIGLVLPHMVERDTGHIVGLSSLSGYRGLPGNGMYCGTKVFNRVFMQSLRMDLANTGVKTLCVCPGWVATPMTRGNKAKMQFVLDPDKLATKVYKAMVAGKSLLAVPHGLAEMTRFGLPMPDTLYDLFVGRRRMPFA